MSLPFLLLSTLPEPALAQELQLGQNATLAETNALVLSIEGSDDCLDAGRLVDLINQNLVTQTKFDELTIVVSAGQNAGFLINRDGQQVADRRFFQLPASCSVRHDVYALAISLALEHIFDSTDNENYSELGEEEVAAKIITVQPVEEKGQTQKGASVPFADSGRDESTKASPPLTDRENSWVLRGGLAAGVFIEVLPEPAFVAVVTGEAFHLQGWSIGAGLLVSNEIETEFPVGRAFSRLWGGRLQGCYEPLFGLFRLAGCLGATAGVLHAEGRALWGAKDDNSFWLAGLARLGLRYPAQGRFGVLFASDLFVNFHRTGIQDGSENASVENAGPLGASGFLEAFVVLY